MKRKMKLLAVILGVICSYTIVFQTGKAMGIEPGSNADPLVSKSYVDKKIDEIIQLLNQSGGTSASKETTTGKSSSTTAQNNTDTQSKDQGESLSVEEIFQLIDLKISNFAKELEEQKKEEPNSTIPVYTPIEVEAGNKIVGAQGTEMILRSGAAKAIASPQGGLQDMTDGVDIKDLEPVPKYHLMIIPRGDGRGFAIEETAWVMVRGGYEIQPISIAQ